MKDNILAGRSAIVTGGRRGIGRAIARAFAAAGANVTICDKAADGLLDQTAEELEKLGSHALAFQIDVSNRKEVAKMIQETNDMFGRIDILANCAGVWIPGETLVECSEENWDRVIDTNLKGTYLCCQAAAEIMIRQKKGSIINISSRVGLMPGAGAGAYPVSKAGIIMMTRQFALELASCRVRVNAIAPGIVKTDFNLQFWKDPAIERGISDMVPLGRLAEPEEIAQAALFLASDDASYITGEVLCVDGGWSPSNSLK
ncbi:MAG: SDR family oxidoreductase [Acidobacteria bacterium]|nr:SDR family oxidoreductase [Acidobacteriota bacterium]